MNGKSFTHVLLLLAMLFSQMATNAHMITHMHVAVIDCDTSISHSDEDHHNHSDLEHTSPDNVNPDSTKTDCSIFHAFAGANGITPAHSNIDGTPVTSALVKRHPHTQVTYPVLTVHPIRGPPSYT